MLYVIIWLVLSFVIAYAGSDRKIGFGWSLFLSLFLSPIIGFIVVVLSEKKEVKEKNVVSNVVMELDALERIKNILPNEQYEKFKQDIISRVEVVKEDDMSTQEQKQEEENSNYDLFGIIIGIIGIMAIVIIALTEGAIMTKKIDQTDSIEYYQYKADSMRTIRYYQYIGDSIKTHSKNK